MSQELGQLARTVIDSNGYMALGTADHPSGSGRSTTRGSTGSRRPTRGTLGTSRRATASEHFVLIRGRDPERGTGVDRREPVTL